MLAVLALLSLTALAFAPALDGEFLIYDDDTYVADNAHVMSGLTWEGVRWAFTTGHDANWFPLTWMSHMLDAELYGSDPTGHHATNLALHVGSTLVLFAILMRVTGGVLLSALAAAFFGLHPLRVESVAWVAERKDVLSVFLGLCTVALYVRYARRPSTSRMVAVVCVFALGLMSKSMLVTLPAALMLLDYWPLKRWAPGTGISNRRWVGEKLPLFALAAISSVVTFAVQRAGGTVSSVEELSIAARVGNALVAYVGYLANTVWPSGLAPYYPHPAGGLPLWQPLAAVALLAASSAALWRIRRSCPGAWIGWLWFLGTLVPVIGLVQVGGQAMADRYTYLPSIGLAFAFVAIGHWVARTRFAVPAGALACVALVAAGFATHRQAEHWRDDRTLFSHMLAVTEENALAHKMMGTILASDGEHRGALEHYHEALRMNPRDGWLHNNYANSLLATGSREKALDHYREAVAADPTHARIRFNWARALFESEDYAAATVQLREALRHEPGLFEASYTLALALHLSGEDDAARGQYEDVLRRRPDSVDAHLNLASLLAKQGEPTAAASHLERALVLDPNNGDARRRLTALGRETPPVGAAPSGDR